MCILRLDVLASAHMLQCYSVSAEWARKSQRGTWKLWSTGWWRAAWSLFIYSSQGKESAAVCFREAAKKQDRRKSQLHMNTRNKNLQHGGEIWWQFLNSCVLNRVPLFLWAKILQKHVTLPAPNASSLHLLWSCLFSQTCCYTPFLLSKDSQPVIKSSLLPGNYQVETNSTFQFTYFRISPNVVFCILKLETESFMFCL